MKTGTASILLKAVFLIFCAVVLLLVVLGGVPGYMSHVTNVRPDLSGWALPMELYGADFPAGLCGDRAVMDGVWYHRGEQCVLRGERPAVYADRASGHSGPRPGLAVLWGFLLIVGIMPGFILLCLSGATFVGSVAIIVFRVLAALVQNAASLRQENELTI